MKIGKETDQSCSETTGANITENKLSQLHTRRVLYGLFEPAII